MKEFTYSKFFFKVLIRKVRWNKGKDRNGHKELPTKYPTKGKGCKQTSAVMKFKSLPET